MELVQLRCFVAVARHGSFSGAAEVLDVAQSTLSRQIRALEVELRSSLFYRDGRGVRLTPSGSRFLDSVTGVLRSVDAAIESVHPDPQQIRGRLSMGLPPGLSGFLVLQLVHAFLQHLPLVTLSIAEGLSDRLCEQLAAGRLDCAVVRNAVRSPNIVVEPLLNEGLYLVGAKPVGKNDKVQLRQIVELPLVLPTASHSLRPLIDVAFARLGKLPNIVFEVDAVGSLADLAASGVGYVIVPEGTLGLVMKVQPLSAQLIEAPEFAAVLSFITPSTQPQSALHERGLKLVSQVIYNELQLFRSASNPVGLHSSVARSE